MTMISVQKVVTYDVSGPVIETLFALESAKKRITGIKLLRDICDLPLKEAKDLYETIINRKDLDIYKQLYKTPGVVPAEFVPETTLGDILREALEFGKK